MVYEETLLDSDDQSSHNGDYESLDDRSSDESWRLGEFMHRCSPIDLLIGSTLTIAMVIAVLSLEVAALSIYCFEFAFSHLASSLDPPALTTLWLYGIAQFFYYLFSMVDSTLLLLSVGIGELLAAVQYGLSLLFGGYSFASMWHQAMRRAAHKLRVRFRAPFHSPRRHMFGNVKAFIEWCKACRGNNEQYDGSVEGEEDSRHSQQYTAISVDEEGETETGNHVG